MAVRLITLKDLDKALDDAIATTTACANARIHLMRQLQRFARGDADPGAIDAAATSLRGAEECDNIARNKAEEMIVAFTRAAAIQR